MDEELPSDFDVIIVGTGLSESILAGALSRIGKKVLHLDHNLHYGGSWSSFNLKSFENWIQKCNDQYDTFKTTADVSAKAKEAVCDNEELILIDAVRETTRNGSFKCYLSHKPEPVAPGDEECRPGSEVNEGDKVEKTADGVTRTAGNASSEEVKSTEKNDIDDKGGDNEKNEDLAPEANIGEIENEEKDTPLDSEEKIDKDENNLIKEPKDENNELFSEEFHEKWRRFNLDLSPKLMYSRGRLVELLIQSNVCRYLEFRNVSRTLTFLGTGDSEVLAPVPCSRADVFSSKFVSVIEKRMLMRVLTICANFDKNPQEYQGLEDKPFVEFLSAKKMSEKLQHFMIHSISMVPPDCSTMDGLKATQKFLQSLGRYGNSAFLWPMYGVGEVPQAFCRLSAVFGGTYCLKRSVSAVIMNKESNNCVAIVDSTGQRISCNHLVIDECYVPNAQRCEFRNHVARAIYVTNKSVMESETEKVSLITVPPTSTHPSIKLIELGPSCCVSPQKFYILHAMCNASNVTSEPRTMFNEVETKLLASTEDPNTDKPRTIWSSYFTMSSGGAINSDLPSNVFVTNGPSTDIGFDNTVIEAEILFNKICPEEEFLPRAPNPEEIIFQDDEGYNTEQNDSSVLESTDEYAEESEELNQDSSNESSDNGEVRDNEPVQVEGNESSEQNVDATVEDVSGS